MKIVETADEVLKVYVDQNHLWLEFEDSLSRLTFEEADSLRVTLHKLLIDTDYFKELSTKSE